MGPVEVDMLHILLFVFQIRVVFSSNSNKPRGYAFIEYEHERDMHGKITV